MSHHQTTPGQIPVVVALPVPFRGNPGSGSRPHRHSRGRGAHPASTTAGTVPGGHSVVPGAGGRPARSECVSGAGWLGHGTVPVPAWLGRSAVPVPGGSVGAPCRCQVVPVPSGAGDGWCRCRMAQLERGAGACWCYMVLDGAGWCPVVPGGAGRCQMVLEGAGWCRNRKAQWSASWSAVPVPIGAIWCHMVPIGASSCRMVPEPQGSVDCGAGVRLDRGAGSGRLHRSTVVVPGGSMCGVWCRCPMAELERGAGAHWCSMVPVGARWCQLVLDGAIWCRVVPDCAGTARLGGAWVGVQCWCPLVPYGASWCRMVPYGAGWCRVVPYGAGTPRLGAARCRCRVAVSERGVEVHPAVLGGGVPGGVGVAVPGGPR